MNFQHSQIQQLHIHLPCNALALPAEIATGEILAMAPSAAIPAIGAAWPGVDGIYAGISRADGDEPDGHLVLLNATPGQRMGHTPGTEWAQSLGNGARLPRKAEGALLYANLRDVLADERWIWLLEQYSADNAWGQDFVSGFQFLNGLEAEGGVRAVRRFAL